MRAPTFALATDPAQQDRAVEIKILSAKRPHMRAFHFAWLSFFTAFLGWFAIPPLMPTLKAQLRLTQDQVYNSNIVSVSSTILGRAITGPLCDRYGSRTVQTALLVAGALPVVSAAFVTTYTGFMVIRFFIGLIGCCFVATAYWTSVMFASNIVGSANAIAAGWGDLGAGAAYLIMPLLFDLVTINGSVSDDIGWRITLCLPAVLMLLVGVCLYRFSDDCPQGNYSVLRTQSNVQHKWLKPAGSTRLGLLAVGRLPVVWVLAFQYACSFGIELQVHNVLSLYYYQDFTRAGCDPKTDVVKCRSLSQTRASLISSLFGLMCVFSRAAGGYASDVANKRWRIKGRVAIQFASFVGQALFLYLYSQTKTLSWSIPLLIFFGFFVQACTGSTYAIVPYVSPQFTGVTSGIVGAGGNVGALCWGFLFKGVGSRAKSFEYLSVFVALSALLSATIRVGSETCPWETEDGSYNKSPSNKCADDMLATEKSPEQAPRSHYELVVP